MSLFWGLGSLEVMMAMASTNALEIIWRAFKLPTSHYSCLTTTCHLPFRRKLCVCWSSLCHYNKLLQERQLTCGHLLVTNNVLVQEKIIPKYADGFDLCKSRYSFTPTPFFKILTNESQQHVCSRKNGFLWHC